MVQCSLCSGVQFSLCPSVFCHGVQNHTMFTTSWGYNIHCCVMRIQFSLCLRVLCHGTGHREHCICRTHCVMAQAIGNIVLHSLGLLYSSPDNTMSTVSWGYNVHCVLGIQYPFVFFIQFINIILIISQNVWHQRIFVIQTIHES